MQLLLVTCLGQLNCFLLCFSEFLGLLKEQLPQGLVLFLCPCCHIALFPLATPYFPDQKNSGPLWNSMHGSFYLFSMSVQWHWSREERAFSLGEMTWWRIPMCPARAIRNQCLSSQQPDMTSRFYCDSCWFKSRATLCVLWDGEVSHRLIRLLRASSNLLTALVLILWAFYATAACKCVLGWEIFLVSPSCWKR